ncbi:hypothetical protein, partial [Marinilactibacillus psychrotolerans]|uniref:hypothetical protein n=1 Tax=Marinilactibacillus psychrotolerans TaxID=191770 RepID=UPI003886BA5A
MKLFWKTKVKVFIVLILSFLLSSIFLPTTTLAQENISNTTTEEALNDNSEEINSDNLEKETAEKTLIDSSETSNSDNIEKETTEEFPFLFEDQLSDQDVLEKDTLSFLNNITVQASNEGIFLNFNGEKEVFDITVQATESNYEFITEKKGKEQLKLYNISEKSSVNIKIKNSTTALENTIHITFKSDNNTQDFFVSLNPENKPLKNAESLIETNVHTSSATRLYDNFLSKNNVNYDATVLPNNEGIFTKPNGMEGAVL